MIQVSEPIVQGLDWKNQLAQAIRNPAELLRLLELSETYLPGAEQANRLFPLRVPQSYLSRIRKGDPDDPLLRQILPLDCESDLVKGYTDDPVGDLHAQKAPGLLHKYKGRALLITSTVCAIHCRYCFRRSFPYDQAKLSSDQIQQALNYLANNPDINEIILSGGDPLSLSDERLESLITKLESLPHLNTLRLHTRLPVVIPQRVTRMLRGVLSRTRLKTVMVVHINHANEINDAVRQAMALLRQEDIMLLNQSVLLRQVNDTVTALSDLSHALLQCGIMPYYLHQLDKVNGAAHFAVDENRALDIIIGLRNELPGYLVPRLVEEHAGEPSKLPLF